MSQRSCSALKTAMAALVASVLVSSAFARGIPNKFRGDSTTYTCGSSTAFYADGNDWIGCCDTSSGESEQQGNYEGDNYTPFDTSTHKCTAGCGVIPAANECCDSDTGVSGQACCGSTPYNSAKDGCCDGTILFSYSTSLCCPDAHAIYPNYGYQCCAGGRICQIPEGKTSCC